MISIASFSPFLTCTFICGIYWQSYSSKNQIKDLLYYWKITEFIKKIRKKRAKPAKAPTTLEIIGPGRTALMSTLLWFLVLWSAGFGAGSAGQEEHCGSARGEFKFHNNSRQGHIMMTQLRLHAEDAADCTEIWYGQITVDTDIIFILLYLKAAHRGRRLWGMLCSWWLSRRFSGSARRPYANSHPSKQKRSSQKHSLSSAEKPFPASCLLAESNSGHLGQHWWVWWVLPRQLEAAQSKLSATETRSPGIFLLNSRQTDCGLWSPSCLLTASAANKHSPERKCQFQSPHCLLLQSAGFECLPVLWRETSGLCDNCMLQSQLESPLRQRCGGEKLTSSATSSRSSLQVCTKSKNKKSFSCHSEWTVEHLQSPVWQQKEVAPQKFQAPLYW